MAIRVTQIDNEQSDRTILRVEGKLQLEDIQIVEQVFEELRKKDVWKVEIDLTAISFINSDSAEILRQMEKQGAILTGLDFFAKQIIETHD